MKRFPIPKTAYGIFDDEPGNNEEDNFIPQESDNIPWMALVSVVPQALTRSVEPSEREIDRHFDWFGAAQECDDIMNNIDFIQSRK